MTADRFVRMPRTAWIYPLLAALFYVVASVLGFGNELTPGASAYLTVPTVLATLTLILPNYTRHAAEPSCSSFFCHRPEKRREAAAIWRRNRAGRRIDFGPRAALKVCICAFCRDSLSSSGRDWRNPHSHQASKRPSIHRSGAL